LIEFIDDVSKNLEDDKQTDILIMDLSKAFDNVSHSLVLHRLNNYDIEGKDNSWIERYLRNKTQAVVI
jgi:hypothetical protein